MASYQVDLLPKMTELTYLTNAPNVLILADRKTTTLALDQTLIKFLS